jgi:hypothetical protein
MLLVALAGRLPAEVTARVQATGLGLMVQGDRAQGFEQAKKAALRQAVEEGLGTLITSQTRVQNFALLEDEILSRTEGFVSHFAVLEHGPLDAQTYQVKIDAVVQLADLHLELEALDLLIESAGNPYILCLGKERYISMEGGADRGLVGTALIGLLKKTSQRFNIAAALPEGELQPSPADLGQAAALGQQQGADIVVRGEAVLQPAQGIKVPFSSSSLEELGLHSVAAQLRVEALWVDTGEIFASLVQVEKAADTTPQAAADKAIRRGVERLGKELVERLAADWREKVYSGRLIRLVVEGEGPALRAFERDFPLQISGVEKLYPRGFDQGVGVYEARVKDTGFALARQLTAKGLGQMDIAILQVSLNSLRLHLSN